jgi:hypothetical protein
MAAIVNAEYPLRVDSRRPSHHAEIRERNLLASTAYDLNDGELRICARTIRKNVHGQTIHYRRRDCQRPTANPVRVLVRGCAVSSHPTANTERSQSETSA